MKKGGRKNTAKKNLAKYSDRQRQKKRAKLALERELRAVIEAQGLDSSCAHLSFSEGGRDGKAGASARRTREAVGVYLGSTQGYGFVRAPEDYPEDIFIPSGKEMGAIDGDEVRVAFNEYSAYTGERRTEGRVVEIKTLGLHTLVGVLAREESRYSRGGYLVAVPDRVRLSVRPRVTDAAGARVGAKVMLRLKRGATARQLTAEVIECFGRSDDERANYRAILAECEIEEEFSAAELAEAQRLAAEPISDEQRVRLTREVIFTIDGAGAKDLDDAVSVRRTSGGYILGVHIADVSHYVREKTALDRVAMRRGTSVYFTDKVVPMLPPSLSNGACSLNAGEDKYALSAKISLDKLGRIRSLEILPTVIRSRVRGVYSEVNSLFSGDADEAIIKKYKPVRASLDTMRELYEILLERRTRDGYIELDIPEAQIILDAEGVPVDIVKRERGVAERIIEQLMLTANEAVARELNKREIPTVYRIHDRPSAEKTERLAEYLSSLGLDTSGIRKIGATSRDYARVLEQADGKGLLGAVSGRVLRAMSKAEYSDSHASHFGLGIEYYCHFTSPIRRLADLATHRIIRNMLLSDRGVGMRSYAARAARAATDAEARAEGAERKIENLYKAIYMKRHIDECFDASVSSVTAHGAFLALDNTCEGFLPIEELGGRFYFDERSLSLRWGERSYTIGDRVKIRVESVDLATLAVRFSLAEEE